MTDYPFDPEFIERLREQIQIKQEELSAGPAGPGMVPLKIACTMTSCSHGRHCLDHLRQPRKDQDPTAPGSCRDCGVPVVDLPSFVDLNYGDPELLIATSVNQQHELIRAHYWHVPIDQWANNQALRLGRKELHRRVEQQVLKAMTSTDIWAGRAAPYSRNIIAYAQHATGTCCRSCAAYWHGLPRDRDVAPTDEQLKHVVWAARSWVDIRLHDLPDLGQTVDGIARSTLPGDLEISELDDSLMSQLSDGADPAGLVAPEATQLQITPARGALVIARSISLAEPQE